MPTKVIMPQLGESVVEGTVVKWLCAEGDTVEEFDSILEVESAKVSTEIPSPAGGKVLKILVEAGETVKAGTVIAWIGESGEAIPENENSPVVEALAAEAAHTLLEAETKPLPVGRNQDLGFISPVVARIAAEKNVDLYRITGSGQGGRITKQDVLEYAEKNAYSVKQEVEQQAWETPGEGDLFRPTELQFPERFTKPGKAGEQANHSGATLSAGETLQPLSSIRKSIAAHMLMSKQTSPHVTTVMEADMKAVTRHREINAPLFQKQGVRLTFTAYFIAAIVEALKKFPLVNSSWTDAGILLKRDIHIGMATSLGEEGLIVPVIKNAQRLSLAGLAQTINDLAERARLHQLKPDEVNDGTFTITNHGTGGSLFATPIINQPQCAILGVGAIQKRAVVVDDAISIRPMVYLSLTFDHRILDGAAADGFLNEVVKYLEHWHL